jgi:hypothetical protein
LPRQTRLKRSPDVCPATEIASRPSNLQTAPFPYDNSTNDPAVAQQLTLAEQHEWFQQQRSRRTVLKGGLITAGAALATPTLLDGPAGAAGKSLYAFSAADSYEGHIDNVSPVGTYVNEPGGTTTSENVTWSQVRYTGYCLLMGQVTPPDFRGSTTLLLRGLDENGNEVDRFTLSR